MSTHKAKIVWSEVCKPKDEGGFMLEANRVCCLKTNLEDCDPFSESATTNWLRETHHMLEKETLKTKDNFTYHTKDFDGTHLNKCNFM